MATAATSVALVGAGVLLWAALEKARDLGAAASTLRQLGVPGRATVPAALVVLAELTVALALVFRPDLLWTQAGVMLLAAAFAVAGLLALRRDEPVRCTCFGAGRRGYLGTRQIAALVPWAAGAAFLNVAAATPGPSEAATLFAGLALALATVRFLPVLGAWREARGDRRSARETYVWLRR